MGKLLIFTWVEETPGAKKDSQSSADDMNTAETIVNSELRKLRKQLGERASKSVLEYQIFDVDANRVIIQKRVNPDEETVTLEQSEQKGEIILDKEE